MQGFCLDVRGEFACFTRPEMKAERVSYDLITPSAARAVFEAVLWKPAIRWQVERIEVLSPVRWVNLRRNEVAGVVSTRNAETVMHGGSAKLALHIEDERQQRAGLFLRDVRYRLHARFELTDRAASGDAPGKFAEMFRRRASKGQCVNQPYLGCREFSARFRLVDDLSAEPVPLATLDADLGWMLYDMDFATPSDPRPRFFRARIREGVLNVPPWDSPEVVG
ncbi:MAG TPA: type I-C CRISPR-associated protein Cas5c [Xanthomonadaceae bacterium]|nr:type I-C CRISPR-associated protein Cas5c [Xanthomonadaceae bacterium]